MKRLLAFALAGMMAVTAGCVLDDESGDSENQRDATKISELTMGGGVFYFKGEGYAIAHFGTFDGTAPFENARVFVNGVELQNNLGIFTNAQPLAPSLIDNGAPIRIAVYAFGDSVVHSIALPEAPVIRNPVANAQLSLGDSLTVEVDYPGDHGFISLAFNNQDNVAAAFETNEKHLKLIVPGNKFITGGPSVLTALASNASGPIPEKFDINNQYEIFLVSTMVQSPVTFVKK